MSWKPGDTLPKDPSSKVVYLFDWDDWLTSGAAIATSTYTVDGADAALTTDNGSIVSGGRQTQVRVLGGTAGITYTLTNHIVTNTSPTEEDDRSVSFTVKNL